MGEGVVAAYQCLTMTAVPAPNEVADRLEGEEGEEGAQMVEVEGALWMAVVVLVVVAGSLLDLRASCCRQLATDSAALRWSQSHTQLLVLHWCCLCHVLLLQCHWCLELGWSGWLQVPQPLAMGQGQVVGQLARAQLL